MHLDLYPAGRIRDSFQGALELLKASSVLLLLFVLLPQVARGTAYYVSCAGNDNNNGTSTSTPWATLAKASSHTYAAGDELLLQNGCVWTTGTLQPTGSGASGNPILLANYGTGALPRIIANNAAAVYLLNLSYWTVQNLDLSQVNQTPQALDSGNQHGKDADQHADTYMWAVLEIRAENSSSTCTTTCTSNNITIENLVVHDGQWIGIFAEAGFYNSGDKGTGYINNLTIQNVEVRGNQAAGIAVEGTFLGQNAFRCSNVQVLNSWVYDNAGDGIVISQVNGGVSQGNHTAYNGLVRNACVGNWTWNSQNVNIQFNESDHNKTPLSDLNDTHARDGGGYDLDLGSINSTVQYNWSHDNYGEGVLLLTWPVGFGYRCCTTINATVRYNVFERDGQKQAGGITIFGGVNPGWIYGNTVYNVAARPDSTGAFNGTGGVLTSSIYAKSGSPLLYIYNNNFITDGTVNPSADDTMVWGDGKGTFTFNNNSWHRVEGGDDWYWSGDITSFSAWQGKGFDSAGMDVSPSITGTLGAGPVAYQLGSASPLINTGANINSSAPGGMGTRDYFGTTTPQGSAYDIGAAEYSGTYSTQNSNATPVGHTSFSPSVYIASLTINTPTVSKGGTATWSIVVKDASGNPVSGVSVTCWLLNQSWNAIDATLTSSTDSTGTAAFSTSATSSTGTYYLLLSQVQPATSYYYDSSQNAAWTGYFTVQ